MSQAGLLLLLWDALQQRETTFGQVLDLSAACGLDGRPGNRTGTADTDRPASRAFPRKPCAVTKPERMG